MIQPTPKGFLFFFVDFKDNEIVASTGGFTLLRCSSVILVKAPESR